MKSLLRKPFISFSGLDGAGKSTQIDLVATYFRAQGCRVKTIWSRGGYTPLFSFLKSCIRFVLGKKAPASGNSSQRDALIKTGWISRVWLCVAMIDLIVYYGIYFRFLGMIGIVVIADRYLWDTAIDFKLNFSSIPVETTWLWIVLTWVCRQPSTAIYLDIPLAVSLVRITQKHEPFPDTSERLAMRYTWYQNFLDEKRFTRIDAIRPINEVHMAIVKAL